VELQQLSPAEAAELAVRDAEESLEDAVLRVLETNLNAAAFKNALELEEKSPIRGNTLEQFKREHPTLAGKIDEAVKAYDVWSKRRGFLDGPADLQRLLKGAGALDFRLLAEPDPQNPTRYDRLRQQRRGYENFAGTQPGEQGALRRDERNTVSSFDQYLQADWPFAPRLGPT
jgi:hypothetical protein